MGFFKDLFRELQGSKPAPKEPSQTTIEDGIYGPLQWVHDPGWWIGSHLCPVNGPYRLIVDPSPNEDRLPEAGLKNFYDSIRPRIASAKELAIADFLPTFNEAWNDGAPLSAEQFAALIEPDDIHVWAYGSVEVTFKEANEEDPLGGHALVVSFHKDGSTSVGLEG